MSVRVFGHRTVTLRRSHGARTRLVRSPYGLRATFHFRNIFLTRRVTAGRGTDAVRESCGCRASAVRASYGFRCIVRRTCDHRTSSLRLVCDVRADIFDFIRQTPYGARRACEQTPYGARRACEQKPSFYGHRTIFEKCRNLEKSYDFIKSTSIVRICDQGISKRVNAHKYNVLFC